MQESTVTQVGLSQNMTSKNRGNERLSMTKNSLMNSRAHSVTIGSMLGNKNLKELKS